MSDSNTIPMLHTQATRRRPRRLPPRRGVQLDVGDRARLRGTRVEGLVEQVCGLDNRCRVVRWDPDAGEQAGVREIVPVSALAKPRGSA